MGDDEYYLSPNRQPVALPSLDRPSTPRQEPPPSSSPVLPVLPRIVSQPTIYGTPAVHLVEIPGTGTAGAAGGRSGQVYEEAPTPAGFQYPAPLGGGSNLGDGTETGTGTGGGGKGKKGKGKGKGKRKSVTLQPPGGDGGGGGGSGSNGTGFYTTPEPPSSLLSPQPPVVVPAPTTPVIVPVVPVLPVLPPGSSASGGSPYYNNNNNNNIEDEVSDMSFDSATKRNTMMNAQSRGGGQPRSPW